MNIFKFNEFKKLCYQVEEADLKKKLESIGITDNEIGLTLEALRPDLFNCKLFHGRNVSFDLFNSEDD